MSSNVRLYTTHSDIKLTLDDEDDEIRRAQNKTCSERVWECAFPSTCSLELDFQVQTEYQAIDTCERALTYRFEPNVIKQYSPYKMAVNITPMNSNTRGGAAIDLIGCRSQVDSTACGGPGGRLQKDKKCIPFSPSLNVGFKQLGDNVTYN